MSQLGRVVVPLSPVPPSLSTSCERKRHRGLHLASAPPPGSNASVQSLCPSREYHRCFGEAISQRYLVLHPWTGSAQPGKLPRPENVSKWFALGLYRGWPKMSLKCSSRQLFCRNRPRSVGDSSDGRGGHHAARAHAGNEARSGRAGFSGGGGKTHVACDGTDERVSEEIFLAIGVASASSEAGHARRRASRQTWARSRRTDVLACFLLSSRGPEAALLALRREAQRQHDMLFFDVAESATLTPTQAKLAGFKKRLHGHCVFKNWAWVRHAAARWPSVPWIAKLDDDTLVNLPPTLHLLGSLGCHRHAFVGPMLWTSWLREVPSLGIRSLPCGYSTGGLLGALKKLRMPMTTLFNMDPTLMAQSCDQLGASPPFPFALGGGYFVSSALLQRLARSQAVAQWVASAEAAAARQGAEPQVIFFSDTTMGYWLSLLASPDGEAGGGETGGGGAEAGRSHADHPRDHPTRGRTSSAAAEEGADQGEAIAYIDIMPWAHDHCCPSAPRAGSPTSRPPHGLGACGGANKRPPSPSSMIVHGLKGGGFHYAFEQTGANAEAYDSAKCITDVFAIGV